MATATIHSPSSQDFDPAAYTVVGCFDNRCHFSNLARLDAVAALSGDGYRLGAGGNSKCGHCGTHIRYSALLKREAAREFIFVGEQCLGNRFADLTKEEFKKLRETARLNRERATLEERIDELLESHPVLQRLLNNGDDVRSNAFLSDVRRKFADNGRLTDRQIAAVAAAFARGEQRKKWAQEKADREASRAAERRALEADGVRAPEGRVTVVGEIVSIKWHDASPWGARRTHSTGNYKVVVKTEAGWACWVTLPRGLDADPNSARGRRIRLDATLVRSDRDQLFAFGKRPTNARFLS